MIHVYREGPFAIGMQRNPFQHNGEPCHGIFLIFNMFMDGQPVFLRFLGERMEPSGIKIDFIAVEQS